MKNPSSIEFLNKKLERIENLICLNVNHELERLGRSVHLSEWAPDTFEPLIKAFITSLSYGQKNMPLVNVTYSNIHEMPLAELVHFKQTSLQHLIRLLSILRVIKS